MQKTFYVLSALLLLATFSYAQKAFEMISYKGKIGQQTVQLDLADGYLMGSEIRLGSTKQAKRYLPEPAENKLLFLPEKPALHASSFELAITDADRPPQTLKIVFINGKQRFSVYLKKLQNKG